MSRKVLWSQLQAKLAQLGDLEWRDENGDVHRGPIAAIECSAASASDASVRVRLGWTAELYKFKSFSRRLAGGWFLVARGDNTFLFPANTHLPEQQEGGAYLVSLPRVAQVYLCPKVFGRLARPQSAHPLASSTPRVIPG